MNSRMGQVSKKAQIATIDAKKAQLQASMNLNKDLTRLGDFISDLTTGAADSFSNIGDTAGMVQKYEQTQNSAFKRLNDAVESQKDIFNTTAMNMLKKIRNVNKEKNKQVLKIVSEFIGPSLEGFKSGATNVVDSIKGTTRGFQQRALEMDNNVIRANLAMKVGKYLFYFRILVML